MPLTDTAIRKTKPSLKPIKLTDGEGLYLLLSPKGARWWCLDYRRPLTSKRSTLSLGTYPETSLAEARSRRDAARKQLGAGIDPGENRKATKDVGLERAANNFEIVAREWLDKRDWVHGYRCRSHIHQSQSSSLCSRGLWRHEENGKPAQRWGPIWRPGNLFPLHSTIRRLGRVQLGRVMA